VLKKRTGRLGGIACILRIINGFWLEGKGCAGDIFLSSVDVFIISKNIYFFENFIRNRTVKNYKHFSPGKVQ